MAIKNKRGRRSTWKNKDLLKIYKLRNDENKSWLEISKLIKGKSIGALRRKYSRIDWPKFLENPDEQFEPTPSKWSDEEMIQLDAYLQSGQSYEFIADKLERTITSVERQSQVTDWKAWREIRNIESEDGFDAEEYKEEKRQILLDQLISSILTITRNEFERLKKIKEDEFLERVNLDKSRLFIPFDELRQKAVDKLIEFGYGNDEALSLKNGTYIIVGDSHGKHTKKDMFKLLEVVNKTIKPSKIIHVGHILDDDNDISYDWGKFNNLIILAKEEELKVIQEQRNKFKFNYDIIRETINIGDTVVFNQDIITDYVKTPISNLDTEIFDDKAIVNCHRLEFISKCCNKGVSYFASPGCLCESHIIKTIKQIDFDDGRVVKRAFHEGFIKYRRMKHTNRYWEQGLLVVNVNDKNLTVVPCPIKETSKGFTTSYFDKIISSRGVFKPEKKIFINGDMHCDLHDINVLDVQEQICLDYKPDVQVNVGDTFNYLSLNHHIMDRGGVILNKKILDEAAHTHYVLKRVSKWAKKSYLIYGNHERFEKDFVEKYPQFGKYLDFQFICNLESLGYDLIPLKNMLKIDSAKFVHGEIRMYGQTGSKMEKASRTFGRDVFIGHVHRPGMRFGCVSVGLTGKLDQNYNEPDASNWVHGFGLCNQFKGQSWSTTIAIVRNKCLLNKKIYKPKNVASWKTPKYEAELIYKFEK